MRKIATMTTADALPSVVFASNNPEAMAKLAGKTLLQVGSLNDLSDTDITFPSVLNGKQEPVKYLGINLNGTKVLVGFSKGFPADRLNDADYLLKCEFRKTFVSVKEDDGVTPKMNEEGKIILDETRPYISFGKPSGITIVSEEAAFAEVSLEQKAG